jgi:hypothetical protein
MAVSLSDELDREEKATHWNDHDDQKLRYFEMFQSRDLSSIIVQRDIGSIISKDQKHHKAQDGRDQVYQGLRPWIEPIQKDVNLDMAVVTEHIGGSQERDIKKDVFTELQDAGYRPVEEVSHHHIHAHSDKGKHHQKAGHPGKPHHDTIQETTCP